MCRRYTYDAILMPDCGTWIYISDIDNIKIIKNVITLECPILINNDDKEVDEDTCFAINMCVNNPNTDLELEKWIEGYNTNYREICKKCSHHWKIFLQK